jgi:SAM-dependent methyltransferase
LSDTNQFIRYLDAVKGRPPRDTLLLALDKWHAEHGPEPGFAVDLGCGVGRDTAELLRRGWRVLAIDREAEALERLHALAGPDSERLATLRASFAEASWPTCELVNASFSLPLCRPEEFPALWRRVVDSLRPGGRFAGQLLGVNDDWAGSGVTVHTPAQLAELLAPFEVESLQELDEDGVTAVGSRKHWHLYHVVARKL